MRAGLALLLTLTSGFAFQQNPSAPQAAPAAISGVVIDATTQKPVPGAVVQLAGTPGIVSASSPQAVFVSISPRRQITDELGRFVFDDLAPNSSYTLLATRSGFLDGGYGR